MIHVGFTGTREGMTAQQRAEVARLIRELEPLRGGLYFVGHHGDCVGADAQFHDLVCAMTHALVVIHPPTEGKHRAWCKGRPGDQMHPSHGYLERNRDIVSESAVMIATPRVLIPARGGTWYTIGHARKVGKPLAIVFPSGVIAYDGAPWPA